MIRAAAAAPVRNESLRVGPRGAAQGVGSPLTVYRLSVSAQTNVWVSVSAREEPLVADGDE